MNIIYSQQAKNELAKIDWRTREKIILFLRNLPKKSPNKLGFATIINSDLYRVTLEDYLVISKYDNGQLHIMTVVEKTPLKIPSSITSLSYQA